MKKLIGLVVAAVLLFNSGMVSADPGGTATWQATNMGWVGLDAVVLDYKLPPGAASVPLNGYLVMEGLVYPCDGTLVYVGSGVFVARLNTGAESFAMVLDSNLNGTIFLIDYAGDLADEGNLTFQ